MATGVEVAGIALAVFPIAVHGLTQMREGIETIKHWKRFRVKLDEYAAELTTAKVFYLDTLEELFMDIVGSDKELLILMNEPGGPAWKKPEYEQSLRRRLDRSYDSYLQIMFKMQNALSEMRMELGIDESGKVSGRFSLFREKLGNNVMTVGRTKIDIASWARITREKRKCIRPQGL